MTILCSNIFCLNEINLYFVLSVVFIYIYILFTNGHIKKAQFYQTHFFLCAISESSLMYSILSKRCMTILFSKFPIHLSSIFFFFFFCSCYLFRTSLCFVFSVFFSLFTYLNNLHSTKSSFSNCRNLNLSISFNYKSNIVAFITNNKNDL